MEYKLDRFLALFVFFVSFVVNDVLCALAPLRETILDSIYVGKSN
jgi:hypothetical protein